MQNSPILIIGKTAKTGWRVDQRLQAMGYQTRAVSRSTTPVFDWEDQSIWRQAMAGMSSAYVTFHPDLAIPSAEQTIKNFVAMAEKMGIQHVVLLSGRGEEGARRAEIALQKSGLHWNVIRASWFMQNFSESFMIDGILNGELILPAENIPEPFIDIDDIADVAVAALTKPHLRNQLFEVSGPRALTFAECAREISTEVGYPVQYNQVPIDTFLDTLKQDGAPDPMLWLMRELFTVVFDGRNAKPTFGVEEALGRPATDFSEFVRKAAKTGVWERSGLQKSA